MSETKASDIEAEIKQEMKRMEEAEQVRCPCCRYLFDQEDLQGLVTSSGDDGPQERECPECDCKLIITECVERTYEVKAGEPAK